MYIQMSHLECLYNHVLINIMLHDLFLNLQFNQPLDTDIFPKVHTPQIVSKPFHILEGIKMEKSTYQ